MTERIWRCKIGGDMNTLSPGSDLKMRAAVAQAFHQITGRDPEFIFSGWAAELTEAERAVVESRMPRHCDDENRPHQYECKSCGHSHDAPVDGLLRAVLKWGKAEGPKSARDGGAVRRHRSL